MKLESFIVLLISLDMALAGMYSTLYHDARNNVLTPLNILQNIEKQTELQERTAQ